MSDYFSRVGDGVQYLIALGSILGLLGIIAGLYIFIYGSSRMRVKAITIVILSMVLVGVCGLHTGTRYFRIY